MANKNSASKERTLRILIPTRLIRMKNTRRNKHTFKHFNKQHCKYPCDCQQTKSYMFIARSYIFSWKDNENNTREVYVCIHTDIAWGVGSMVFIWVCYCSQRGILFQWDEKADIGITGKWNAFHVCNDEHTTINHIWTFRVLIIDGEYSISAQAHIECQCFELTNLLLHDSANTVLVFILSTMVNC